MKKYVFFQFIFFFTTIYAQNDPISILGVKDNSFIKIRWSPNNYKYWSLANKSGYILKKYKLEGKEKQLVFSKEIKVRPLVDWKLFVEKKEQRAIIAQAIFGSSFEQNFGKGNETTRMIQQVNEQDQRFTSTLLVLESDFEASLYCGLGFIDSNIDFRSMYLYSVEIKGISNIHGAFIFNPNNIIELPKPTNLQALYKDKQAILSWDYAKWIYYYSLYDIERSEDGINYTKVNKYPYSQPSLEGKIGDAIFYTDSLPFNYKKYFYRVRGISMFDVSTPPSDSIYGYGYKDLGYNAQIKEIVPISSLQAEVFWDFEQKGRELIKGFYVMKSNDSRTFIDTISELLDINANRFRIDSIKNSFYISIFAVAKDGEGTMSMPELVQLEDSTPPSPPDTIFYKIDSIGVVKLSWPKSITPDWYEYRVFAANNINDKMLDLTPSGTKDTFYIDTLNLKKIQKFKFYSIMSLDKRYNRSKLSKTLAVPYPDIIPPTPPQFGMANSSPKGAELEIFASSSEDAYRIYLYRLVNSSDKNPEVIDSFINKDLKYIDSSIAKGEMRMYVMKAKDSNRNYSSFSQQVIASRIDDGIRPEVDKVILKYDEAKKEVELYWNYKYLKVKEWHIYKTKKGGNLTLYKKIKEPKAKMIYDSNLQLGNTYSYAIQAVFENNAMSEIIKTFDITIE